MSLSPTRRSLAAGAAAAAVVLSACGGSSGESTANADDAGTPKPGGSLTIAVGSDAGCIDPQQVGSNDTIYTTRQLVDSLTDQDPKTGEIVPWLAESWEVSPDATQFTFHLVDGATFSDGTPVDAAAVKANFDTVGNLGPTAVLATGYVAGYTGTEVVDERTATISFDRPNAQFLQATSTFTLGLVSVETTTKTPAERCQGVVASGPFVLDSYQTNSEIVLSKRDGYDWGSSLFKHEGEAYLDKVVYSIVPEAGVRSGSLQSGQVDVIGAIGPQDEAALSGSGIQLLDRGNPGLTFGLGVNNAGPILSDERVRQAINHAIDREEIVAAVHTSQTKPATSILASTTPSWVDQGKLLGFDATKAEKLLDDAGWAEGPDGIRVKDGQPLTLTVHWFANAATNQPTLELIQQQLKKVGIDLALQQNSIAEITQVRQSGDYDFLWGNLTRADGDILRTNFSTTLANAYKLPATPLDDLLTQQAAETDPAARADQLADIQTELAEKAYYVPVHELTTVLGVGENVQGLAFEASSRIQLFDTWKS